MSDVDSLTGGVFSSCVVILSILLFMVQMGISSNISAENLNGIIVPRLGYFLVMGGLVFGLAGSIGGTRRLLGRAVNFYVKILGRLIGKSF